MYEVNFTAFKEVTSSITGRNLFVNTRDDAFAILPTFSADAVALVASEVLAGFKGSSGAPTPEVRPYLDAFLDVRNADDFLGCLLELRTGYSIKGNANTGRISDLLIAFWVRRALVFPRNSNELIGRYHSGRRLHGAEQLDPRPDEIIAEFRAADDTRGTNLLSRKLLAIMFSTGGVREAGDLTPDVVDGALQGMKLAPSLAKSLLVVMKHKYGLERVPFTVDDYGAFGRMPAIKSDNTFGWVLRAAPGLGDWVSIASRYLEGARNIGTRRSALNRLFDYLIGSAEESCTPSEFLMSGRTSPAPRFEKDGVQTALVDFFDWILDTYFVAEDDNGHPYRMPGFKNPLKRPAYVKPQPFETVRDAMPTRLLRRLVELIEENDFEWPKSAFEAGTDSIRWRQAATGDWLTIWSPVRAMAILMKLQLPARTFQVRVCNSGEADPERFIPETGNWVPNHHPLAGQLPYGRPMGIARRMEDPRSRRSFAGLYFNTNKTGDLGRNKEDRGYVVPWHNPRILALIDRVRTFQETYNPVFRPTAWLDIAETPIQKGSSEDVLRDRGHETFLFRDPCSGHPDQPVTHQRLALFWNKACGELEDRIFNEGERTASGQKIQLVHRGRDGRPTGTVYNLHALRVTMITAWAEQGVPIEILMKVAGHATAIMTLYYQKRSIGHVTEVLNEAALALAESEQSNWQKWLESQAYEDLPSVMAHNDPTGPSSFVAGRAGSTTRRDHGLCPVGCTKCHEGGPKVEAANRTMYHPVPGGSSNCVCCRFFVTGPCFLLGLQAHFDDTGFRLREASKRYADSVSAFQTLDHQRKESVAKGEPFSQYATLDRLASTLDQRTREVDQLGLSWHATYNLIQQSLTIIRDNKAGGSGPALVMKASYEEFQVSLDVDESGLRQFELIDKICHSATLFPSIESSVPNLHRMRSFDQLIARCGQEPVFMQLSEADALTAGNELSKYLYLKYGREDTNALLAGKLTLKALGIDEEGAFRDRIEAVRALGTRAAEMKALPKAKRK